MAKAVISHTDACNFFV